MTDSCKECPKCGEDKKESLVMMAGGCGMASKIAMFCKSCSHRWQV